MARIAAVATALPANRYSQADITATIAPMITEDQGKQALIRRLHSSSRITTRHLVMPLERYTAESTFTQTNDLFIDEAADLTERALRTALARAHLKPADIDYLMFTSVTGIAAPSIDALLVARMGLRPDVKRVPIFGLGCVAGAAGIARVNDYLVGHPHEVGVLLAVELCSLTFQRGDTSTANMVASGLFGDGAAAVVLVGDARARTLDAAGPDVVDTRSRIYPDSETVIGFNASSTGFRIVLTSEVAELIARHFGNDVTTFLAANGLSINDISTWMAHPGGPKVLEGFQAALELDDRSLDNSWRSLAAVGNLSSVSVLHILEAELGAGQKTGDALLFALGPGVSAELVLLRWPS